MVAYYRQTEKLSTAIVWQALFLFGTSGYMHGACQLAGIILGCLVRNWEPSNARMRVLLGGAIPILQILDLLCNCSVSLEKKPQIVSLGVGEGERPIHLAVLETDLQWLSIFHPAQLQGSSLLLLSLAVALSVMPSMFLCAFSHRKKFAEISLPSVDDHHQPPLLGCEGLIFFVRLLPLFLWAPEEKLMCSRKAQVLRVHHLGPEIKMSF